ncbi:MAG: outer membrane lipoprotein carrier protein LolA [Bacteroidales bacterium]|jgi:outer membrane lipoprotein-sorting protein|nr:outer membrane lipoprotein carrier protein LolA [Bacteroidales bacterium]
MKKNIIIFFCLLAYNVISQNNIGELLNESEKSNIVLTIKNNSASLKSLECSFTQEKTSTLINETTVLKGFMFYKNPAKLRWEYSEPEKFALIINNNKTVLKNGKNEIVKSDKMLKYLGNFIINAINSNCFSNTKNFNAEYYKKDKENLVIVKMIPVSKQLKQMFSNIIIELDNKTFLANKIIMNEVSGDNTTVIMINKKINSQIADSKFITD